ncbi:trypsin-like serine peptidase [Actinospica robiniae]|uniref:trypsin-like serine peptidase n=1 Tax=Actinospica robiniae TaxID=304901 RepID=UPI000409F309|nr:serine protease [Actinospica robiniae]
MDGHRHSDVAWRVRVDDAEENTHGAGILLSDRHVLTCAHVVADAGAAPGGRFSHVRISSTMCHPDWSIPARLSPDSWVYRNGTWRGDVALLELDEPTPCGAATRLSRAPVSGGLVRLYGFPAWEPRFGLPVVARLAGAGGREGEWAGLSRVEPNGQWLQEGYSGSGALALDGEFEGRVIGLVARAYVDPETNDKAGWMLPTETVLSYLPQLAQYVDGEQTSVLPELESAAPDRALDDPLRLALTQELTKLLIGPWAGTVVLTGGATQTGTSWLVRLVRTADPATRPKTTDIELSRAPRDTVLGFGTVDAAYDAGRKSLAEVRTYLADRLGFRPGEPDVLGRLLRRKPPACLVIAAVDRAADPDELIGELLGPLARRAWSRGIRLVLGFDAGPPEDLHHEVSLGPELATGRLHGSALRAEAEQDIAGLGQAEADAGALQAKWGLRYVGTPQLPRLVAPRLRVQLAIAGRADPNPEFARIRDQAEAALHAVRRYSRQMHRMLDTWEDLSAELKVQRVRAERFFGAEDVDLMPFHDTASEALWNAPIDLTVAAGAIRRYADEVDRRRAEGEEGAPR